MSLHGTTTLFVHIIVTFFIPPTMCAMSQARPCNATASLSLTTHIVLGIVVVAITDPTLPQTVIHPHLLVSSPIN